MRSSEGEIKYRGLPYIVFSKLFGNTQQQQEGKRESNACHGELDIREWVL